MELAHAQACVYLDKVEVSKQLIITCWFCVCVCVCVLFHARRSTARYSHINFIFLNQSLWTHNFPAWYIFWCAGLTLLFSLLGYKCRCVFQTAWQLSYILFRHCRFHWCWKQALQWSAMIPFTCALKTGSNALKSACHLTRSIPKYFLQACVASSVPAKLCAAQALSLSVCSGVYFFEESWGVYF